MIVNDRKTVSRFHFQTVETFFSSPFDYFQSDKMNWTTIEKSICKTTPFASNAEK